jgi:hypothetical protein
VSGETATAGGFTIHAGNGETAFKTVSRLVTSTGEGLGSLEFTIVDVGDDIFDSAALIDDAVVTLDPPLYVLRNGASLTRTDTGPLERFVGVRPTFDALMVVCCGSTTSLAGPLLEAIDSDLTVPFTVLGVMQGGRFQSTTTAPLVTLERGTHALGTLDAIFDIAGVNTTVDAPTGLSVGTDTPLRTGGTLLEARAADITTEHVVKLDTALLEASLPLLRLQAGSNLTSNAALFALTQKAAIAATGPLASLDRSGITIKNGAALQLAGGSLVRVTGNLFELRNGSRLTVLNGPLASLAGGSVLSVSGALIAFGGTGGNIVQVTNSLCPCVTFGGIPVALQNGALASNVSIGAGAIKNASLGSVQLSPNAALISVSGPKSAVTITGAH